MTTNHHFLEEVKCNDYDAINMLTCEEIGIFCFIQLVL